MMELVTKLLHHAPFLAAMDTIEKSEAMRLFCRHGLDHSLDVARIMYALCLENGRDFSKETIYLTALLHDIGRSSDNDHHDEAGARLAHEMLLSIGADEALILTITEAISLHRDKSKAIEPKTASLGELLALADNTSRPCYRCKASTDCYWPNERRNHTISY